MPNPRAQKNANLRSTATGVYDAVTQGLLPMLGNAARGSVAATLGAPGDILGLLSDKQPLPTSQNILDYIPPVGSDKALTGMAETMGGFVPAPGSAGLVRAAKTALNPMTYGRAFMEAQAPAVMSKIFIGEKAKTWDKAAAEAFKKLEAQGVGNKEAWQQTGTFRSPDGKLRQEIDDSASEFLDVAALKKQAENLQERNAFLTQAVKPNKQKDLFPKELTAAKKAAKDELYSNEYDLTNYNGLLADPKNVGQLASLVFKNAPLYAAYPNFNGQIVRQGRDLGSKVKGQQSGAFIDVFKGALDEGQGRSTAAHEFQHAVQDVERFALGGNPQDELQRIIQSNVDELVNSGASRQEAIRTINSQMDQLNIQAFENYRKLAGEAEARAVQARINMTPEQRRAAFPLESYDVPVDSLILRSLLD